MAKFNNDIERIFNEGFEGFEHEVSDKVWQNIDSELFSSTPPPSSSGWATNMGLALLPLAFLVGSTFLLPEASHSGSPKVVVAQAVETPDQPEKKHHEVLSTSSDEDEMMEEQQVEEEIPSEVHEKPAVQVSPKPVEEEEEAEAFIREEQEEQAEEDYKAKEMPKLSEKPYFNHDFYKNQGDEMYGRFSINKLRKGVLLVRLNTGKRGIDALRTMGQNRKADKLQAEIDAKNKRVMEAFRQNYHFSEVLFFYSDQSDKVREMDFTNMFLTPELEIKEAVALDPSKTFYMILDIGPLKVPGDDGSVSANALSRALVVKDRDFDQMYRPFPFYVRAANEKLIERQVERLNEEFIFYYSNNRIGNSN